ncbi:MAG: HMA2 domain-containing protein [Thermodesulfobacteriota bacterium]
MDLQTLLLKWGLKIKILHRLPGRLRLEIPALRKVPPGKQAFAQDLIGKMVLPTGITSVEPSFITGTILLRYDSGAVTEREVLANIQALLSALVDYREELWSISQDNGSAAIERLNGILSKANRRNGRREQVDLRS